MRDRYGQEMHEPRRRRNDPDHHRFPHAHPDPQDNEVAISFCGGPGAGKTLMSKLLMQRLRDEGFTVRQDQAQYRVTDTDRDTIYVRIDDEQRRGIAAEIRE